MNCISILIKPASSFCNLKCKYCFYKDVAENRDVSCNKFMGESIARELVRKAFTKERQVVTFSFQGGEPTLVGIEFYKKFISYVKEYNKFNAKVIFSIQTNGYTLDKTWAKFFKEHKFLVGVSLDGPKNINDTIRIYEENRGTFDKVIKGINILEKYKVPFNILCVLTAYNSKHIKQIYKFYKNKGFKYLQFIPCLDPLDSKWGNKEHSLDNESYEYALNNLFKLYKEDYFKGEYTSIRLFDNYVGMLLGNPPENCGVAGKCTCYYVVEANGDIYPCDFYCIDKCRLGNIMNEEYGPMGKSLIAVNFQSQGDVLSQKCRECEFFAICRGGCKRYRTAKDEMGVHINYFCKAYYNFFKENIKGISSIAKDLYIKHEGRNTRP